MNAKFETEKGLPNNEYRRASLLKTSEETWGMSGATRIIIQPVFESKIQEMNADNNSLGAWL